MSANKAIATSLRQLITLTVNMSNNTGHVLLPTEIVSKAMEQAADALENQPDIVRCKDCKHWYKDECSHLCALTGDLRKSDWFCADGERRTNDV